MPGKPKKKRKSRHAPRSVQGSSTTTGSFRMVVAANPGSSVTVAPELDLVKAALLYGDRVTLISPVTTMLLRVEGLQRFSPSQLIELMRRVAPVLLPPDEAAKLTEGMAQVDEALRPGGRGGFGGNQLLRAALLQQFAPAQQMLSQAVREL